MLRRLAFALLLAIGLPRSSWADAPPAVELEWADRYAPLAPPALEPGERRRLEAGAIVTRDLPPSDPAGIGVLVIGLVDATPAQVWSVMSDCEEQDEFLPRITHAAVRDRDADSHTCDLVVDLPLPLGELRSATRHRVRRLPDGGHQRSWDLLPGDWGYLRNSGSWSVYAYAAGRRSLLVNCLDLLPKSAVPVWILRAAQTRQAPATFDAIRARVREQISRARYGRAPQSGDSP
jgi:hypothetical protein